MTERCIFVKISGSLCLNLSLSCEKSNKNKKQNKKKQKKSIANAITSGPHCGARVNIQSGG